jgi:8-oxo-dGTP diphosphatase
MSALGRSGVGARARRPSWSGWPVPNVEVSYHWYPSPVPVGLPVGQVLGWLLDDTGRVLVQEHAGSFSLPGGSPEPQDTDLLGTLAREAWEESQVTVSVAAYLGFEQARGSGRESFAQVRMAGRIGRFAQRRPNPDGGAVVRPVDAPARGGTGGAGLGRLRAGAGRCRGRAGGGLVEVAGSLPHRGCRLRGLRCRPARPGRARARHRRGTGAPCAGSCSRWRPVAGPPAGVGATRARLRLGRVPARPREPPGRRRRCSR